MKSKIQESKKNNTESMGKKFLLIAALLFFSFSITLSVKIHPIFASVEFFRIYPATSKAQSS